MESFDWAAPLAAVSRSLSETNDFMNLIGKVNAYDWIEQTYNFARKQQEIKLQIHMANYISSLQDDGLLRHLDLLVMKAIAN